MGRSVCDYFFEAQGKVNEFMCKLLFVLVWLRSFKVLSWTVFMLYLSDKNAPKQIKYHLLCSGYFSRRHSSCNCNRIQLSHQYISPWSLLCFCCWKWRFVFILRLVNVLLMFILNQVPLIQSGDWLLVCNAKKCYHSTKGIALGIPSGR